MENRVSMSQQEELLDYLAEHTTLAKGVGLGARSKESVDREWDQLALRLNAHGSGASKTGPRWKRYWHDLKHKTKAKVAALRRDCSGTGGGPATQEELPMVCQKVLAIIGEAAVHGDTQHRVPIFETNEYPLSADSAEVVDLEESNQSVHIHSEVVFDSPLISIFEGETKGHNIGDVSPLPPAPPPAPLAQSHIETESPARPSKRPRVSTTNKKPTTKPKQDTTAEPAWLVDLEQRRVAAEEKIADAMMIMAEAARTTAENTRIQTKITLQLIELLKK